MKKTLLAFVTGFVVCIVLVFVLASSSPDSAPSENPEDTRKNYYPNTEELGPDEMRVISLGTGTPNFRRSQASAAWLVELGNGEKFIFDIGEPDLLLISALLRYPILIWIKFLLAIYTLIISGIWMQCLLAAGFQTGPFHYVFGVRVD